MDYTLTQTDGQPPVEEIVGQLMIPSALYGFQNTDTVCGRSKSGRDVFCFVGEIQLQEEERNCTCGCRMHLNDHPRLTLRHLPFGSTLSCVRFPHHQLVCPNCGASKMQDVSFQADGHRITVALEQYASDLLATGNYTLKEVAEITGLGKNTVKDIDRKRLQDKYTIDGKTLKKPDNYAKFLGIDEFKLHDGYRYATHIIDMETGHILWIAGGKKKQVVYDFIEHVGMDWMSHVEAVACDMNSDFQEAFEERCEWIQPVFDYFHIVKNFNEKVVSAVRKDEQARLAAEGKYEEAKSLKGSRYILMSNRETLQHKDELADTEEVIHRGSSLFNTDSVTLKGGYEARYDELLSQNKLLFTCDLVKEALASAYRMTSEIEMAERITEIIDICAATENKHFMWFGRLLENHFEGIIAHAAYNISAGKIEGINNKIKTIRRQGYGYPDDEYFFLKIMDASRHPYTRNPASHKIYD